MDDAHISNIRKGLQGLTSKSTSAGFRLPIQTCEKIESIESDEKKFSPPRASRKRSSGKKRPTPAKPALVTKQSSSMLGAAVKRMVNKERITSDSELLQVKNRLHKSRSKSSSS